MDPVALAPDSVTTRPGFGICFSSGRLKLHAAFSSAQHPEQRVALIGIAVRQ